MDQDARRRIDNARDVLVGKIPDPKAQVEQITSALIYKFMDDMDKDAQGLGGKPTFFTNGYEKYAWSHILDPRLGGQERLNRYAEALATMSQNPHLPQLFRTIFKDAFLPYRDPTTLNLFLKEIDGFTYDHSENLGDAYEYLLSILGSQGDAGQFRTPRHIIDFMVRVVDPKKNETLLDPASGTAGFVISSYRHIIEQNHDHPLTPDEKERLAGNLQGYDISPDMVRIGLVNMYLHGFPNPHIYEYDTLTSEERWDEQFDVCMANPPFMTPKGGIRPHRRFQIQANRSEVLFVDYIAEHLKPTGRAAVIVPEGIIFQSANAYKALRKMLVETWGLWAVVSLPAGVFNPYSGVKTSILFLDRAFTKKNGEILFAKVQNDGFNLGAQRRLIDENDLPEVQAVLKAWHCGMRQETSIANWVSKAEVTRSDDYNLTGDRYRESVATKANWPMVALGDERFFQIEAGGTPDSTNPDYWNGDVKWATLVDLPPENFITEITDTVRKISTLGLSKCSAKLLPVNTIIVSSRATIGRVGIALTPLATNQGFKNVVIKDCDRVQPRYVALALTRLVDRMTDLASGGTFKEISKTDFSTLQIPVPPIDIQRKIVAELDGYQRIIDGAKQVIANWRPTFDIDPSWPLVWLRDLEDNHILELRRGQIISKTALENDPGNYPVYSAAQQNNGEFGRYGKYMFDEELVSWSIDGGGKFFYRAKHKYSVTNVCGYIRILNPQALDCHFLYCVLAMSHARLSFDYTYKAHPSVIRDKYQVPLPPLDTQQRIVSEIEKQEQVVESCRSLISTYEAKISAKIAGLWGATADGS